MTDELPSDPEAIEPDDDDPETGDARSSAAEAAASATRAARMIEAILFASTDPVDAKVLQARLGEGVSLDEILGQLSERYREAGVNLVRRGTAWAFRTAPDLAESLAIETTVKRKLSRAAVETLAIIAYHQPVTRAEIEDIRGVALSKGTLDILLEAGWIQPRGRREVPGRPLTWGTSAAFLDHFGLEGLGDLPGVEEMRAAGLLDTSGGLTTISMGQDEDDDGEPGDEEGDDPLLPFDESEIDEIGS